VLLLRVTSISKDIILQDINFGRFEILPPLSDYFISHFVDEIQTIPQEPNYAPDCGVAYSHPHVSHNIICIGDGKAPCANALAEGRIADYFDIVNTVLNTYGENNGPHVSIDAWKYSSCYDCGNTLYEEYPCELPGCDHIICDECTVACNCDNCFCNFHDDLNSCEDCGCELCPNCIERCKVCKEYQCNSCIDECNKCKGKMVWAILSNKWICIQCGNALTIDDMLTLQKEGREE